MLWKASASLSCVCNCNRGIVLGSVFVCDIISFALLSFFFFFFLSTHWHTHSRNLWWFPWLQCSHVNTLNGWNEGYRTADLNLGYWRRATVGMVCSSVAFFWHSSMEKFSHVCLCGGDDSVCVCVCWELEKGWGRWGLKKQRGLLLGLSPVPCLLAVNLISKEKYTLCLYNAGLCLRSASEPSTILQIVSSLLKCFQTVTVEPVRLPVNCLASFPNPGLSWASSEERRLSDYGAAAGVVASLRGAGRLSCHTTETRVRHGRFLYITASSPPHLFIALPPLWTVKIVR